MAKSDDPNMSRVTIWLPNDLADRLKLEAADRDSPLPSKSDVATDAFRLYFSQRPCQTRVTATSR